MAENPSIIHCATRPSVVKSSLVVALVVGIILNMINQGDAILGDKPVILWKVILTFMVPYCVSTYGAVMALRSKN